MKNSILEKGAVIQSKFSDVVHVSGDVRFKITGKLNNVINSVDHKLVQIDTSKKILAKASSVASDELNEKGLSSLLVLNYRGTIDGVDFNVQVTEILSVRTLNNKES